MINEKYFQYIQKSFKDWDTELVERTKNGESLVSVQEDQYSRGRRSAEISRIDNPVFKASFRVMIDGTVKLLKPEEIDPFVNKWWREDPNNREIYMRK